MRPDSHTRHSTTHSRPLPDIFCDPSNSDRPPAAEKPRCIPYTHPISLKFGITKFSIFGNTKYINHFPPYNFTGWGGDVLKTRKLALGDRNLIGARVTQRRLELGMKQTELLAQLQLAGVDMSIPALSLLEGQKRPVSDIELNALADILHVSVNWLLGRMEP